MRLLTLRQVSLAALLCLVSSEILEPSGHFYYESNYKNDHAHPEFLYVDYEDDHGQQFLNTKSDQDEITPVYQKHQAPSNYQFSYGVHDEGSGTAYSRKESSDDGKTTGQYQVHLPDGRIQTVTYTADENGYRAKVSYEGEAVHHPGPPPSAPLHSPTLGPRYLESPGGTHSPVPPVYHGEAAGLLHIHLPLKNEYRGDAPEGENDLNSDPVGHGVESRDHPSIPTLSSRIDNGVKDDVFKDPPLLVTNFPFAQVAPPPPTIYFESPTSVGVTPPLPPITPYPFLNAHPHPIIKSHDPHAQDPKALKPRGRGVHFDKRGGSLQPLGSFISGSQPIVKSRSKSTPNRGIQDPLYRGNVPHRQ